MNRTDFVRKAAAVLVLAVVFGATLYAAARIGPFAALLGVAIFGLASLTMRTRAGAPIGSPSAGRKGDDVG